tara:strand:- start:124 stop:1197 length:1074 start_codon:yes stop_codon:yes gene_type:complete
MKIDLKNISIKDLTNGFKDNLEAGVIGYGGKLDIRPPYQREFVYTGKQRDAVIDTVTKGFPLNVMYWAVREDGNYEIIDGQQRTISICQYVCGEFSFNDLYFHNLPDDKKEAILNYDLTIYFCEGSDSEKLAWFETINIAGEELYPQELRNAVYHGSWTSDAKRYFSKTGCAAYQIAGDYLNGSAIRQQYLETAIKWINANKVNEYMAKNQNKPTAIDLWNYFQAVISWVEATFPNKRKIMKGLPWGEYYNEYKNLSLDPEKLEIKISSLLQDDDVTNQKGIYAYLLSGKEKHLNIRAFDDKTKQRAYEKQRGICNKCKEHFDMNEMDADHIKLWKDGGKTEDANCQMLCVPCNRGG